MIYSLCLALIMIGVYGVVVRKNIVKIVISFIIIEYGVNLLLILIGYRMNGHPPILEKGINWTDFVAHSVDPLPQALVLTAVVIHLGLLALMVAVCIRLYDRYRTFDITKIRKLRG